MFESKEVIISIGNQQITGKNCFVKEIKMEMHNSFPNYFPEPISNMDGTTEITLSLICNSSDIVRELYDENYKPKIRNKKVDDCTIQELLFAVRQKIK